MRWHKKSNIFSVGLVLVGLYILIRVFIILSSKAGSVTEIPIGDRQSSLFKSYIKGEVALYHIDIYAKLSAQQAIYNLAQNGGLQNSECGAYGGYQIWSQINEEKEEKKCYPGTFNDFFQELFNSEMNEKTVQFLDAIIPQDNFETVFNEDKIQGKAKRELIIPLTAIGKVDREKLINSIKFDPEDSKKVLDPKDIDKDAKKVNPQNQKKSKLLWPLSLDDPSHRVITSCKGLRSCTGCSKNHPGTDVRSKTGDTVLAVDDGVVTSSGGKYGTITIKHTHFQSRYLHNSELLVDVGQTVTRGDPIAKVGGKGPEGPNQYPAHLHFEIIINGLYYDPLLFYDRELLDLKYKGENSESKGSNCVYNSHLYPYEEEIKERVVP